MLGRLFRSLRYLFSRRRVARELDNELAFHLEQEERLLIGQGMPPAEARRQVRLRMGGSLDGIREQVRDESGAPFLENLWGDLAYAWRNLRSHPGYLFVAVLTLGLGIGSNLALFSAARGLLWKPLPFRDESRVVVLRNYERLSAPREVGFSAIEFQHYSANARALESLTEFHLMSFTLLGRSEPELVNTGVVSAHFFDFLGVRALHGRTFLDGEDQHGAPAVLILSHRYFMRSFGGDPKIVGQTVRLNDRTHTIVGVVPPLPEFPGEIDVYMPTSACPTRTSEQFRTTPSARMLYVMGRLQPGVVPEQAAAELTSLARGLRGAYPAAYPVHDQWGVRVTPVRDELARRPQATMLLLFAATALLLLIACANAGNLAVARTLRRQREIAIRTAIGASRVRLLQQLLVEGILVAGASCVVGIALAASSLQLLARFAERLSPRAHDIRLDPACLVFALGVTVFTALLAYALPAWRTPVDLIPSLREGSAGSGTGRSARRLRGFLVAAQVAFSLILLTGAGLLFRSFVSLTQVDAGYQTGRQLALTVMPNWTKVHSDEQYKAFFERLIDKLRAVPGVSSAVIAARVPLASTDPYLGGITVEGEPPADARTMPPVDRAAVGPGYFAMLGAKIIEGREFTDADRPGTLPVAVVNESMARRRWTTTSSIGHRLSPDNGKTWFTVVGVVADIRMFGLDQPSGDEVFYSFAQNPMGMHVLIATAIEPHSLMPQVRAALHDLDPEQAVARLSTLEELRDEALSSPRVTTSLLGLFASLTLLITVAGIAGVSALAARQRRAEIGIRLALGGRGAAIAGLIAKQEMSMVLWGLTAGLAGSFAVSRLLGSFLYGVAPEDPLSFGSAIALLACVSGLACFVPARRAAAIDPMLTLRSE